ncbi:hypothetical protein ACOCJ7_14300 [Knoellia sp. CPCC 206453]|uniref:hypothetical protein n=1 Tax=Knoellia pratensis TaxID=3404796 RepID=UPI003605D2E3
MELTTAPLVGRPHWTQRFASGLGGGLFLAIGLIVLVKGEWLGAPLALFALFVLADLWRKVTVSDTSLSARGRVMSKQVALSELTDGGLSPLSRIWVQPRDGRPFYLRMVSQYGKAGAVGVEDFLPQLAIRVESVGGHIKATDDKRAHPRGTHPLFSA